jgi:hypothetical protein
LPCPSWVTNASTVLDVTAVMVAIATVLTAAELLAMRADFRKNGLFDPRILGTTRGHVLIRGLMVLSTPRIAFAQLGLGVMVVLFVGFDVSPGVLFVALAAAAIVQRFLLPYGGDGSDMMARVLTITLAIAVPLANDSTVVRIAIAFIAAQLCLAYGASGVAKLFGRPWRSGSAVQRILHTAYGHAGFVRTTLDRWPNAGRSLTRLVIAIEIAFPVAILLGGWIAVVALAGAAALQVMIAVAMGLNRFTPWFLAAFPATVWATCHYGVFSP